MVSEKDHNQLGLEVLRDAIKDFETQGPWLGSSWYRKTASDNFAVAFIKLPTELHKSFGSIAYTRFWQCLCRARLHHGI